MREFELYTRILNPTFVPANQTCMEEVKADHSVKLITRGISEYRLYRFDLDSSDADFLCFFNKNHSAGSGVQGLKDLRCFCDYVLLAQKSDKLYVFIIELKSGKTEGAVEQLRATELFMDYIKETAEFVRTTEGLMSASVMCEKFLFDSAMQYAPIEKLSGGEKRRLYLLKILMEAPNVIILDEPTNDLDIQTLRILEDFLDSFAGIVITVSHDRYFLDRVVTRIFSFEKDGTLFQSEGGYSDYLIHTKDLPERNSETVESTPKEKSSKNSYKQPREKTKLSYKEQKE